MCKVILGVFSSSVLFAMMIAYANSQDGELAAVTLEMFTTLQAEVNDLYSRVGNLQDQLQSLAASLQNLAKDTAVVGSIELAELEALIEVSNKQEGDISKLFYSNGLWQQNFRVINNTFERLRKVVVFPIPTLNNPAVAASAARRILPVFQQRPNVTIIMRTTPKPAKPT